MLTTITQPIRDPALLYARLLRENHALIAEGRGDGPEAEALADRMDGPWYAMTSQEQDRLGGLSEDLYALRVGNPKQVVLSEDKLAAWRQRAMDVYRGVQRGTIDPALEFFRQPIPSTVPRHLIWYLQGGLWEKLGDPETALEFVRAAAEVDSEYAVTVLTLLWKLGRVEEAVAQTDRVVRRTGASAAELYYAAGLLLGLTRTALRERAEPVLKRVLAILQGAEERLAQDRHEPHPIPDLSALIASAIGLCLERLGDVRGAVEAYDRGLALNPDHPELLTARGLALLHVDAERALADFRSATDRGAKLIWPWYILARQALVERQFATALKLAVHAAALSGPPAVLAEVYETIAIANAFLGQPPDRVHDNLQRAVALDPTNERIRRNHAASRGWQADPEQGRQIEIPGPGPSLPSEEVLHAALDSVARATERYREQREASLPLIAA